MRRDAVSRKANVGTVGKNGLNHSVQYCCDVRGGVSGSLNRVALMPKGVLLIVDASTFPGPVIRADYLSIGFFVFSVLAGF